MKHASRYVGIAGVVALTVGVTFSGIRFPYEALTRTLLIGGAAALAVFVAFNPRELLAFSRKRSARQGTSAIVVSVLFTAVLVLIQAISVRNTQTVDLTRNKRFTLTSQTVAVLADLNREITMTGFYRANTPARARTEELLRLYATRSENLRYEIIDPDRSPSAAEQLGGRYQSVVVTDGERTRVVSKLSEETLTNAILQVSRARFKALYFTTGHAEKQLEEHDRGGYSSLYEGLVNGGYDVRGLSLLDVNEIPSDCQVLVIAGPRKRFLEGEVAKIRRYLDAGGAALFLIDPRVALPNLEELLATYTIALDPIVLLDEMVVVDTGDRVFDATVTKIRRYETHTITNDFNVLTMFPMARPVRLTGDPTGVRVSAQYLAATEPSTWGETNMESFKTGQASKDEDDYLPPLPIAAVVTKLPPLVGDTTSTVTAESRIVVFGDSDWVNNVFYGVLGNADLFLNTVAYLAQDENLISIRPKDALGDRVYIRESQMRMVFALCLVLLPGSVVAVGASLFFRRRKR